ncbi:MAG: hypothetical protein DRQ01_07045 [Ignavibacteriae bacterium]|nr:MAG: hypothetical protein DRQ01_07045 [Ignavibacteriota bacterium]
MCTDNSGNFYVTGRTYSDDFPLQTLIGAYNDSVRNWTNDAFILKFKSSPAGVSENNAIPNTFELHQNYPNPFNPSTTISYSVPEIEFVTLKVYDVLGKEVATLINEEKQAGSYEVEFGAQNLSSGIYFYKLQAGSFVETRKMILLK